ncbi:bifunctional transcriptional activator/DNA repair enzyme AdaA [Musicola paradisiaca]|uniref:Methylated-DNA--protein-cysteine methyltransferase n=1 Tax=Musicola paradisiaca (strain Ech703) TaxID=579405 RepID=C6C5M5_MUSP7|nr:trifunctional transcriptional activator/DNA repair protein Ada/methylated-DNA--[protein]-cysteine S-methyltransferase [Musicola paradisiaca]ACS83838.1 methylated-DNA/protein-cysteine methyltransferase [Musicola paradisiaca Ech703]
MFDLPDDDELYRALIARDPTWEGFAYVGVKSTGIFCRLSCAARKPKRENVQFFSSVATALEAGFRPCKRCRPLMAKGDEEGSIVATLTAALEKQPEKLWSESDLIAMQMDPSTVRRTFKRQFGITFLEMARLRRLAKGITTLSFGEDVISAQLDASYESGSGFRSAVIRHLGISPSQARRHRLLKAAWIDTPIGTMLAVADEHALHLLEFVDRKGLPGELEKLKQHTASNIIMGTLPVIEHLREELRDYFAGRRFRFETPLAQHGTLFTRRVWDALSAIPYGTVESYRTLATRVGNTAACRAVARANGANPLAIVVPCHRVIGADGSLTGYAGGLWRKKWLLEHERRTRPDDAPSGDVTA